MALARPLALRASIAALVLMLSAVPALLACGTSNPAPPVCSGCDDAGIDATFTLEAGVIDGGGSNEASPPDASGAIRPGLPASSPL